VSINRDVAEAQEEITTMKKTPRLRSQVELLKHTPSALVRAARYRSGAGVHADSPGRYGKRDRASNRREERLAALRHGGDQEEG
jgi:hypothetical protein